MYKIEEGQYDVRAVLDASFLVILKMGFIRLTRILMSRRRKKIKIIICHPDKNNYKEANFMQLNLLSLQIKPHRIKFFDYTG